MKNMEKESVTGEYLLIKTAAVSLIIIFFYYPGFYQKSMKDTLSMTMNGVVEMSNRLAARDSMKPKGNNGWP